jgi:uncharacterized protein (TIGR02246 family)
MRRSNFWIVGGSGAVAGLAIICLAVAAADKEAPKPNKAAPPAAGSAKAAPKSEKSDSKKPDSKSTGAAKPDTSKAEAELATAAREAAKRFVENYNKHDVKATAACFAPGAVFLTEKGGKLSGRDTIAEHFAAAFAMAPDVHLELQVDSVHLVTSTVALTDGKVEFVPGPGIPAASSRFVALLVFQEGRWLLDRVRDFPADDEPKSNHERLHELEWLVGEWMEEGEEDDDAFVATTCRWSDDQSYLLQEFTIRMGDMPPRSGSTRIGWDPLTRQIKSWTFDSDGGYSEALWTRGHDLWILKTKGVTHLGRNFSGTSVLRRVNASTFSWATRDRVEGGMLVPDRGPLLAKRRPPPPGD